jgi:hypothetical protein
MVASVLAVVLLALGARLRGLLRLPVWPGLRLSVDLVLGSWALAVVVLLLGITHLWFPRLARYGGLALAALGRWRRAGWRWEALAPILGALVALPVALSAPFYDALVTTSAAVASLEGGVRLP